MPSNFNDAAVLDVLGRIESFAMASGRFDSVNGHEPKSAPGNGVAFAVWVQNIKPAASGQAATSGTLLLNGRVYIRFNQFPYDLIDPQVLSATLEIMAALSGDFKLGGADNVRAIDLLGMEGMPLSAQAGYVDIDKTMYRVMTINIPLIINDMFTQVA